MKESTIIRYTILAFISGIFVGAGLCITIQLIYEFIKNH